MNTITAISEALTAASLERGGEEVKDIIILRGNLDAVEESEITDEDLFFEPTSHFNQKAKAK